MSKVRTFRAATMQEALEVVRDEMGSDAVILHTKQVSQKRFLPWGQAKELVEITAGLEVDVPTAAERTANRNRRIARQQQQTEQRQQRVIEPPTRQQSPQTEQSPPPTRLNFTTPDELTTPPIARPQSINNLPRKKQPQQASAQRSTTRKEVTPQPQQKRQNNKQRNSAPPQKRGVNQTANNTDLFEKFSSRLDGIEKMLSNLSRFSQLPIVDDLPGELFSLYTELKSVHISEEIAREMVFRMKDHCTEQQLEDTAATDALVTAMIESELNCTGSITPVAGQRKVIALVGPTGVGKTTTIAKLAANFQLREGLSVGLVTVDTYRIAAVDQLKTYAEIIDLPMKVVTNPIEMRLALDELAGLDLVLVDTAGRSPHDDLRIQELEQLITGTGIDEAHLVLSGTSSEENWEATLNKFSSTGITSVILTKLDEMEKLGAIVSLSRKTKLPISYITNGQDVPEDIEPAETTRLTQLILGQQQFTKKMVS